MYKAIIFSFSLLMSLQLLAQKINIIPQPTTVEEKSGSFTINKSTPIVAKTKDEIKSANFLNEYFKSNYGFILPIKKYASNSIQIHSANGTKDGYTLNVSKGGAVIRGNTGAGTFYGIQSLIQLLPVEKNTSLTIPAVLIKDAPTVQYRGLMLDVGRHYFPLDFIKKYIDYIALHKMNTFHWHLTEDQGWRIELPKSGFTKGNDRCHEILGDRM